MALSTTIFEKYNESTESQTVPFLCEIDKVDAINSISNDDRTSETRSEDAEDNTRLNAAVKVPLYIAADASEFNNILLENDDNYFKEHIKLYKATRQVYTQ